MYIYIPAKTPKIENSNLHGFELHRPSSKGTRLLLQVIKAIINQFVCVYMCVCAFIYKYMCILYTYMWIYIYVVKISEANALQTRGKDVGGKWCIPTPVHHGPDTVMTITATTASRNTRPWSSPCSSQLANTSQLVKIEEIKFLGISRYKVELRFWLDLNSEVLCGTDSNWDFCWIWMWSWLKSPHHSGFRFRISSLIFHGTGCTPVAGSIFGPLFQPHISKREFKNGHISRFCSVFQVIQVMSSGKNFSAVTWYPTDIIWCLWSEFISPRIRTFVEKRFHGLFSKKKDSKSGGVPLFLIWSRGQLPV